jgi:hypothetical protein
MITIVNGGYKPTSDWGGPVGRWVVLQQNPNISLFGKIHGFVQIFPRNIGEFHGWKIMFHI